MPENDNPQADLIEALRKPGTYPHPVRRVNEIQTHISTVLLTGKFAYKIKKPLDLGFLNFLSLEDRKRYCEEELRLNRRLAPQLYLDVVAFSGDPRAPKFNGEGTPFEYAVKMRQFDQEALLDQVLARGELSEAMIDEIARRMADFHREATVSGMDAPFGTPEAVFAPMQQNFDQLRPLLQDPEQLAQLERLEQWTQHRHAEVFDLLAERKQGGFIRECHGDMHLGNMALIKKEIAIFDGIEFNDYFRWIDVMSELAFLSMDLDDRGAHALSRRVINAYLAESGDYAGLALLRFYQVYRAMVRAKVASIRLSQGGLDEDERAAILKAYQGYADLAEHYTRGGQGAVMITHGMSGSGKSTAAQQLVQMLGAVCVRSDVERKRLHGLKADEASGSQIGGGIYTAEATEATYQRLLQLAAGIARAGFPAVVDATFLKRAQRHRFAVTVSELKLPFLILDMRVNETQLRERLTQRLKQGADASEANLEVLEQQLRQHEPLERDETAIGIDAQGTIPLAAIKQRLGMD